MGCSVKENWPEVLDKCISDARGKPFEWGEHDCCMFAANVVEELTGTDYAAEFRGKYKTMRGASKALGKIPLDKTMDKKLKRTQHPNRGDVVLIGKEITQQPLPALGICLGMTVALIGDQGIEFLPVAVIAAAWDVHSG